MPEDNVIDVSLSVEFSADDFRDRESDCLWLSNRATLFKRVRNTDNPLGEEKDPWCTIDIKASTEEFKKSLGVMEKEGCSQKLIDHLKYARKIGAKWVIFR